MVKQRDKLMGRRAFSALAGVGAVAYFVPAWNETVEAADTVACVAATPTVTEGPYWVDEKLFRSDIRTDPATGVARAGVPLTLTIAIQNLSGGGCAPLVGAYVDIWHCDAKGIYSDEPTYNPGGGTGTVNTKGQKFLRGYQITDDNGKVTFATIYPGWYNGRTIHIHFRVRTYSGTTVLGNFVSQIFFDEPTNNTVLALPPYSRTGPRDTTNASDMVYRVANPERMLASTTGDVASGYSATIAAGVTLPVAAAGPPAIAPGGVANAVSGVAGVTPGSWISIYGTNFSNTARAVTTSDLVNNTLPTSLNGVSVKINGKAAFLQFVSATQVNVLAPSDSTTGNVAVTVTNAAGTSNSVTTEMQTVLPGLSVLSNYVRAVRYPDGAIVNGTGSAETGYTTSAAVGPGDVIALYGTGFGPTSSTIDTGAVFTGGYPTSNAVTVSIGGADADVLWAGLVGPGLYQINVKVPLSLTDGDKTVIATVAGASTQSTALLKVAAGAKLVTGIGLALIHRVLGANRPSRDLPPSWLPANAGIEHLMWIAGLSGLQQRGTIVQLG